MLVYNGTKRSPRGVIEASFKVGSSTMKDRFLLFLATLVAAFLDYLDERDRRHPDHPLHGVPRHELPYFNP